MNPVTAQSPAVSKVRPVRWIVGLALGMLLATIIILMGLWAFAGLGLVQVSQLLHGGKLHISVDQPTVIEKIRALNRLETVSYTMDKIVSGERENPIFPQFLAGDRLLLVVHGEVVAGVDLSKLGAGDVTVRDRKVSVHLPSSEIFSTRLDNAKTKVYSRDTGLFTTPDPTLEGEVRQEAERQLQNAALQDGLLKVADQNARQTLTSLLSGLGFEHVEFR